MIECHVVSTINVTIEHSGTSCMCVCSSYFIGYCESGDLAYKN